MDLGLIYICALNSLQFFCWLHLYIVFQCLKMFFPAVNFELFWGAKVKKICRSLGLQDEIQLFSLLWVRYTVQSGL